MSGTVEPSRTDARGHAVPRPLRGHAGLAVPSLAEQGGGVAYVGRLLQRALADLGDSKPELFDLGATTAQPVRRSEQLRFFARLAMAEAAGKVDWMVFSHVGVARAQLRVPERWRKPCAVVLHGTEGWDESLSADRKAILRAAKTRVAVSPYSAQRIAKTHPDLPPIDACPLALLPEDSVSRPEVRAAAVTDPDRRTVVILGRMSSAERYKGHDQLISCWPTVLAAVPDAQLVCIGAGDDVDRLRAKAAVAAPGRSVLFPGFLADEAVESVMRSAKVFAMPSEGEGFGLVYLKAMKAGLPCVASTADAARDIIVHEGTGLLVPSRDTAALAASIIRLLRDDDLARRLGESGRRRFESEYTYAAFVARLAPILSRAFSLRSRG